MIETLTLRHFRNFSHREISFSEWKNLIIWKNGKGKSNILESLSLPSNPMVESDPRFLLEKEQKTFFIKYTWKHGTLWISYDGEENKKKYLLEWKNTSKQKIAEKYPHVVSFHPMAMNLMYLSPSARRDFLDEILIKTFPEYRNILWAYKKVLTHRNKLLKNISEWKSSLWELTFWNEKYIAWASAVYRYRFRLKEYFSEHISELKKYFFWKVSSVEFHYITKTHWKNTQEISEYLKSYIAENNTKEIILRKTLRWPHLDDFDIIVDSTPLIHYASRGEVKSSLLWLIFLETNFISEHSEKKNVLFLLDDILSELDVEHRDLLWKYIGTRQCIITSIEDFDIPAHKIFL